MYSNNSNRLRIQVKNEQNKFRRVHSIKDNFPDINYDSCNRI